MIDFEQELADRGIDIYQSGDGYMMMNCPMPDHDDAHPSFSVSMETGSFRCFGCEARGSFAELIAEIDGISVSDAKRGIFKGKTTSGLLVKIEKMLEVEDDSIEYFSIQSFHNVFSDVVGTHGEMYLRHTRRLTRETIKRFDLRWGSHGKYVDRVIMPIYTPEGKLLSYAARTVYSGIKPKSRKARSAARTLYGIYELLLNKSDLEYIILVEGEMDAMYLQQHGIPAVSVMGTAVINKYQLRILRSTRATVVLSYDPDEAGEKAVYGDGKRRRGELATLKRVMPTIVVELPEGRDPNDLKSSEVMQLYGRFICKN